MQLLPASPRPRALGRHTRARCRTSNRPSSSRPRAIRRVRAESLRNCRAGVAARACKSQWRAKRDRIIEDVPFCARERAAAMRDWPVRASACQRRPRRFTVYTVSPAFTLIRRAQTRSAPTRMEPTRRVERQCEPHSARGELSVKPPRPHVLDGMHRERTPDVPGRRIALVGAVRTAQGAEYAARDGPAAAKQTCVVGSRRCPGASKMS